MKKLIFKNGKGRIIFYLPKDLIIKGLQNE